MTKNKSLEEILVSAEKYIWGGLGKKHPEVEHESLSRNQAKEEILTSLLSLMPKKKNRKTDVEYGYCVNCDQNIDSAEADCFCTIHNLAVDNITDAIEEWVNRG